MCPVKHLFFFSGPVTILLYTVLTFCIYAFPPFLLISLGSCSSLSLELQWTSSEICLFYLFLFSVFISSFGFYLVHFWLLFFLFLEVNFWLIYIIVSHLAMYRLHLWILTWETTLLVSHRFLKIIYLFMAVLSLCCCSGISLVAASGGHSPSAQASQCSGFFCREA